MAPSLNGLQKLIDTLGESIKKIRLNINAKKSKYIVKKKKKTLLNLQLNYMMK